MRFLRSFCLIFAFATSLFTVNALALSQEETNSLWKPFEQNIMTESKAQVVEPASECDPFAAILESSFSWNEMQNMVCGKKFDASKLKKDLAIFGKIAAITPEVVPVHVGDFVRYREEVLQKARNLKACSEVKAKKNKSSRKKSAKDVFINKIGKTMYQVRAPGLKIHQATYDLDRRYALLSLMMDLRAHKVDFCTTEFERSNEVRFRTLPPAKIRNFSKGEETHLAVLGGVQLIAALQQSCEVAQLTVNGPVHEKEADAIFSQGKQRQFGQNYAAFGKRLKGESCSQDFELPYYSWVQRNPAISFPEALGGRPQLKFARKGTDCSSFVTTAYAISGLKFFSDRDDIYQYFPKLEDGTPNAHNTATLRNLPRRSNSCFDVVRFNEPILKPGDILLGGGHTWIIATAAKDPFGFNQLSKKECNDTWKFKRDFTVLESDDSERGMGPRHHYGKAAWSQLSDLAVAACKARFSSSKSVKSQEAQVNESILIRHKGTPECLMPKQKFAHLVGTKCVSQCPIIQQLKAKLNVQDVD